MKHLLIITLLSISTLGMAQSNSSRLETRISEDGKTLLIGIDLKRFGRQEVHYNQSFDVSHMNGLQIDLLKYRVFASQGVTLPIREMKRLMMASVVLFMLILLGISVLIRRYQTKRLALG